MLRLIIVLLLISTGGAYGQTPLPPAQVGVPYQVQIGLPVNGVFPFTLGFPDLPTWLHEIPNGPVGRLSGIPAAGDVTTQAAIFNVTVTDSDTPAKHLGTFQFSISVSNTTPVYMVIAPSKSTSSPQTGKSGGTGQAPEATTSAPAATPTPSPTPSPAASPSPNPSPSPASGSTPPPVPVPVLHEPVRRDATAIGGKGEPFATILLTRGINSETVRTVADETGEFRFAHLEPLKAAENLALRQVSVDGRSSDILNERVTPFYRNGEELRAIVGYQQAGASAAQSQQNWFFDFYISRPLAFHDESDAHPVNWRWWGNVRVASYPQQGDVPVATFASSFAQQFGQLKVNQLVQSAEFLGGLERRLLTTKFPFLGKSEETRQQFTLSLVAAGGATGPLSPTSSLSVFDVPVANSPQFPLFHSRYPTVTSKFIGFVSPDRDNFLSQYLAGLRLTTTYADKDSRAPFIAAPAMLSVSLGQNEIVTGGQFHGMVLRTEAFYPLPFFNRAQDQRGALAAIYLFGSSQMHLGPSHNLTPLILAPEPTIAGSDPNVTIVTSPSNRDLYRVGVGIDLVHAIMSLTHPVSSNNTKAATQSSAPPPAGTNQ